VATNCFSLVQGRVIRITRLNECGAVVTGACAQVVSSGFASVALSPQYDDGEAIQVRKADGTLGINQTARAALTNVQATLQLITVDPDMIAMMSGNPSYADADGNIVGFGVGEADATTSFALEVWSGIPGEECVDGVVQYGYTVVPWLTNPRIGDLTIENGAATFQLIADSRAGSPWGIGPYNVMDTAAGSTVTAGKLLTAIPSTEHYRLIMTTIAPPEPTCGCAAL
jgi:hypothetical protein